MLEENCSVNNSWSLLKRVSCHIRIKENEYFLLQHPMQNLSWNSDFAAYNLPSSVRFNNFSIKRNNNFFFFCDKIFFFLPKWSMVSCFVWKPTWQTSGSLGIYFVFFKLLFACPTANFRPLSRRQPHSLNVNYCVFTCLIWRSLGTL